ncbi:hypothetical protein [Spiroplasma endosymbiont of Panorpa germanica]|uniref:hypothetical protein n=1 Tax=Spiroplasma endosymbiont of Panorpa germanica TaxID=3066314 RepID=UPI0030D45E58
MSNKKDINENDLLQDIDREKLFSEINDNKMKDSDKSSFVEAIMGNYFLDNDNINFLEDYGYGFWKYLDNEKCICLSDKKFKDCCKKKMKRQKGFEFVSLVESLDSEETYKKYLSDASVNLNKIIEKNIQESKCSFPDCDKKAIENFLYDFSNIKNNYLSVVKKNILDTRFTMGENFFQPVESEMFSFFGFCEEHDNLTSLESLKLDLNSSQLSIAMFNYRNLAYKKSRLENFYQTIYEEFIDNYLNVSKEGYQAMMVFKLRRTINSILAIRNMFEKLKEAIKNNDFKEFNFQSFELKKQDNFVVRDLIYFQVTPKSYTVINSVNNPLINEDIALISLFQVKKSSIVQFMYLKRSSKIESYFQEWKEINEDKLNNLESWVTNNALILTDNILISQKMWSKLSHEDKILYSALNKFRFENPKPGQEFIKMKFFAGFQKGSNFF